MKEHGLIAPFHEVNKVKKGIVLAIIACLLVLVGCSNFDSLKPDEVIANAIEQEENVTYYGELEMDLGEELEFISNIKEWRDNERSRIELETEGEQFTVVNDGTSLVMYDEKSGEAMSITDEELFELNLNPKEQIGMYLDMIVDTHDVKKVDEEKVAGRKAIHLRATAKDEETSLFGSQDIWIDKEKWVVLKLEMEIDGSIAKTEYKKIDFDVEITDDLFAIDLPDGVEVEDISDSYHEEAVTLEDIPEKLGAGVVYIPDDAAHEIDEIIYSSMEMDGEVMDDITIEYVEDGLPLISLMIGPFDDMFDLSDEDSLGDEVTKEQVRGYDASYVEFDSFRSLNWNEEDFSYTIIFNDEDVSLDAVKQWVEEMVEID